MLVEASKSSRSEESNLGHSFQPVVIILGPLDLVHIKMEL